MNISGLLTSFRHFTDRNSPVILTVLASAGVITTAVMTAKATIRAQEIIKDHDEWMAITGGEADTSFRARFALVWMDYIPPLILGGTTIACVVGLNSVHGRRTAAIASAYAVAERSLNEYQKSTIEEYGEEGLTKIKEKIAQTQLEEDPVSERGIITTGRGDDLCYDSWTGRYFRSGLEALKRAENLINHRLINGTWVSLNELYSAMGIPPVKSGEDLGWVSDNLIELSFTSMIADTGEPCIVVDYLAEPKYDPYS